MSEELLVRHCAPTLAGLKTGNLINCPVAEGENLEGEVAALNGKLNPRGVAVRLLSRQKGSALVYVYRPDRLSRDLMGGAAELLCQRGYPAPDPERCLRCLAGRLEREGFPHEIGLFLGYPLQDVLGFIENRGQGCKLVGAWKVYGDPEAARRTFDRFKKCTAVYSRCLKAGTTLEKLTVKIAPAC